MCSLKLGAFNDERTIKYLKEEAKPIEEALNDKYLDFILDRELLFKDR